MLHNQDSKFTDHIRKAGMGQVTSPSGYATVGLMVETFRGVPRSTNMWTGQCTRTIYGIKTISRTRRVNSIMACKDRLTVAYVNVRRT